MLRNQPFLVWAVWNITLFKQDVTLAVYILVVSAFCKFRNSGWLKNCWLWYKALLVLIIKFVSLPVFLNLFHLTYAAWSFSRKYLRHSICLSGICSDLQFPSFYLEYYYYMWWDGNICISCILSCLQVVGCWANWLRK